MVEWIALWSLVGVLTPLVAGWFARLVALDGYGTRPPPRGAGDWSADGLPSHPYGL